jgi:hypothetical protein
MRNVFLPAMLASILAGSLLCPATAAADPYRPDGVDFINYGIYSLGLAAIAGAASVGCEEAHGAAHPACQWITEGSAVTLLVAAIPLFVIGLKRRNDWTRPHPVGPVLVTARRSIGTLGWTF